MICRDASVVRAEGYHSGRNARGREFGRERTTPPGGLGSPTLPFTEVGHPRLSVESSWLPMILTEKIKFCGFAIHAPLLAKEG